MRRFVPAPAAKVEKRNIKIEVAPDDYEQLKSMAARHGVSLKEFVRQAVAFAVANLPAKGER